MKRKLLLDTHRSCLSKKQISQYREEITKPENSPVCGALSTIELVDIGICDMKTNGFCLVKEQLDV